MKNSHLFSTIISQTVLATGLLLGSAVASAATVSVLPVTQDVFAGGTFTVDLVATDLIATGGGSMDVTWDPTVLTMSGAFVGGTTDQLAAVSIATPPWSAHTDGCTTGGGLTCNGVLSSGLLAGLRVGTFMFVTGAADIATLTFTAVGAAGSSTLVTVADGAGLGGGWSPAMDLYEAGTVNIAASAVPIPAAVWLFGSGLLGLIGIARRKAA